GIHCRKQEVAALIAGEHAAGAVAAVRRGGEADDQQPRVGRTDPRHGASPVLLVLECAALLARHLLAPCDESRTRAAVDQVRVEFGEIAVPPPSSGGHVPTVAAREPPDTGPPQTDV